MTRQFITTVLVGYLVLSGAGTVCAQNPEELTLPELTQVAQQAVQDEDLYKAVPFLEEMVKRLSSYTNDEEKKTAQTVRLQLARSYARLSRYDDAIQAIREYLSTEPCEEPVEGMTVLCQVALMQENWDVLKEGGLALEKAVVRPKDRELAEFYLAQATYNLEEYEEALTYLPRVIERQDPEEDKDALAAFRLMHACCLFETGQADVLMTSLPQMMKGDDRYDAGMNLLLVRIADELLERGKLRNALQMYRMVVPKKEVVAWQTRKADEVKDRLARLRERAIKEEAGSETREKIDDKIAEVEAELDALSEVPDYDSHLGSNIADIYAKRLRYWEAVEIYGELYREKPKTVIGQAALYEKIDLLIELGHSDEAIAAGREYLDKVREGVYPRMIAAQLMRYYFDQRDSEAVLDVFGYSKRWASPASLAEKGQDAIVRYMSCFALLESMKYDEAADAFDDFIDYASNSSMVAPAQYWRAMCSLMQEDYPDAMRRFDDFRNDYPDSELAAASLFRIGVCLVGQENYPEATVRFTEYIDAYPDHELLPEALAMRGDLLGSVGKLPEALEDYKRAMELAAQNYIKAQTPQAAQQIVLAATYALTQTANTLQTDADKYREDGDEDQAVDRYSRIISEVEEYMTLFGDDADWAQAAYLKGKALLKLDKAGDAVSDYLQVVIEYGYDPAQQGVGEILFDLGALIQSRLSGQDQRDALDRLRSTYERTENKTLNLRLAVLIAQIDGTTSELGRELLETEDQLDNVPPSALGLMCDSALEQESFERAEELFTLFKNRYSESPYVSSAYHLRSEDLFRQGEFDDAEALAAEVLSLYGAVPDLGWAQLIQGRCFYELEQWSDAAEAFEKIFNVAGWRGPLYAEAMYMMAETQFAQGEYEKAFAFYQRTYLLYKFYAQGYWAANAYVRSAECLLKLGDANAAKNTYRAMILDSYVRDLPQADKAKEVLGAEEVARLLSGQNNGASAGSNGE